MTTNAIPWQVQVLNIKIMSNVIDRPCEALTHCYTRFSKWPDPGAQVYTVFHNRHERLTCPNWWENAVPWPVTSLLMYDFASFQADIVCESNSSSVKLEPLLLSCHTKWQHKEKMEWDYAKHTSQKNKTRT